MVSALSPCAWGPDLRWRVPAAAPYKRKKISLAHQQSRSSMEGASCGIVFDSKLEAVVIVGKKGSKQSRSTKSMNKVGGNNITKIISQSVASLIWP